MSPRQTHSSTPQPPQSPPPTTLELSCEIAPAVPTMDQAPPPEAPNPVNHHSVNMMELLLFVIQVCLAAYGLGFQDLQTIEKLPLSLHFLGITLQLSFLAVLVSFYIRPRHPLISLVMQHVAIFLGTTAFMVSIATKLPTSFMLISVAIYLISILVIIFVNLRPTP